MRKIPIGFTEKDLVAMINVETVRSYIAVGRVKVINTKDDPYRYASNVYRAITDDAMLIVHWLKMEIERGVDAAYLRQVISDIQKGPLFNR